MRRLWRRAFLNQYNLILLSGSALFSMTTQSIVPALVGVGAEVLWLVLGADSQAFRRYAAAKDQEEQRQLLQKQAQAAFQLVGPEDQARYLALQEMCGEIQSLAKDNPSLSGDLLAGELRKLEGLQLAFLQMGVLRGRLLSYLRENPEEEIQFDIAHCEAELKAEDHPEVATSLQQSLALSRKRMSQHKSISASFRALEVKMDTLEKTFRYLKSHIVQIGKPQELADEIEDLISGVDSVEQLNAATDQLLLELRGATSGAVAAGAGPRGRQAAARRGPIRA